MLQRGVFISFEGVDGCGKSTQIKELRRRLLNRQAEFIITREPGGTMVGEEIRRLLQDAADSTRMTAEAELLLFAASRAQLVREVLEPALESGKHIIADRFLDSTTIYQGVARGLDKEAVKAINFFAVRNCLPDVTFLLDLDAATSRERVKKRAADEPMDRLEGMPESFFQDVRDGYLRLAEAEPTRFVLLDARRKLSDLSEVIWNSLVHRFNGIFG